MLKYLILFIIQMYLVHAITDSISCSDSYSASAITCTENQKPHCFCYKRIAMCACINKWQSDIGCRYPNQLCKSDDECCSLYTGWKCINNYCYSKHDLY